MVCFVDSEFRAFGSIEAEKKLKNRLDFAALELDAEVQAKHSRVLHQAGTVGPDHVLRQRLHGCNPPRILSIQIVSAARRKRTQERAMRMIRVFP